MKKYLRLFLNELPKQTYFDGLEVVLDHNEPDGEEISWVREFQNRHPGKLKHIIVEKVDPIGISMNRCIREASGEFVTIWNVDDLRTNNSIELQVKELTGSPNTGIVYGDYLVVDAFGKRDGRLVDHAKFGRDELLKSMILGPFFMFRKELCGKAGYFDEQLFSGADFDLAIRLARHSKAAMAKGILGYYLNEGLGASTRPNSKQPLERTVIELRYGTYEKIDYRFLPQALQHYDIGGIVNFGQKRPVGDYFPAYNEHVSGCFRESFNRGAVKYLRMQAKSKLREWVRAHTTASRKRKST